MTWESQSILRNNQGEPVPQEWNEELQEWQIVTTKVDIKELTLLEQLTDADAVDGTLTFGDEIISIEIYNGDAVEGVFNVNGFDITMPPETAFRASVAGVRSNTVNVTGSTSYIVGRYV